MNLENTVKFHSPKSPQLSDSPRATASAYYREGDR